MNWEQIAGQEILKQHLKDSIANNRVSHAQLFVGNEGNGILPLALAYAKEILLKENEKASSKVEHLNHLDMHFSFPVFSEDGKSVSKRLMPEFREIILEDPYFNFADWQEKLDSKNKQFSISVQEIEEQTSQFVLKSFEGGTKILIIWRADKMNIQASNKLLKFLEEPPEKTIILLLAETTDNFLPTITSRCQILEIPRISDEDLSNYLLKNNLCEEHELLKVIQKAQGNLNTALKIISAGDTVSEFEELFVDWVRFAFQVKKKPEFLIQILKWAETISKWNRDKQKSFLEFCAEMFRLAMLQSYGAKDLVYTKIDAGNFNWDSFSKFIHGANIESILEEISMADLHLLRNGNAKIIWTDLGIKLSRFIHRTP
ncbi:DNA polymerase III subunit [Frigoriflavimonas asaccharolytica]|uniref:DNA polymerase-3 subunit delta n=1 Tax=Frigoriflavimonas asaccharolytica TaxID=2735899 RepID=A0A8J8GCN8_9FLAO|nr:DNA polymerase III subunit delta' [Frigoriflavimonas asaccharolytica]NRS93292.1 DNA polymerase-3 subunit delta' [Frigoriflavimonas asaccharolytica]